MSRSLGFLLTFMALAGTVTVPVWAEDKPLVSATTEATSPVGVRPSTRLTSFVMKTMGADWQGRVDECLVDKKLGQGDYPSVLQAIQVKSSPGHTLWFVRPTTQPYCMALYGAHLFDYFLIEQHRVSSKLSYRVVFRGGGDGFAIYSHLSHGLNDIEATGCIMTGCRAARMEFDGREYRPARCTLTHFDKDQKEIRVVRPCGSDYGRDDQASGFNPGDR